MPPVQNDLFDVAGHGGNDVATRVADLPASPHALKRPAWRAWRLLVAKGPLSRAALGDAMAREYDYDIAQVSRAIVTVQRSPFVVVQFMRRDGRRYVNDPRDVFTAIPEGRIG